MTDPADAGMDNPPMTFEETREWIAEHNPEAVLFDGYEDAIMGLVERCSMSALVVYDMEKCVQILIDRDGMDYAEAREFFEFNTLGCWAGDNTPVFFWPVPVLTDT